MKEKFVRDKYQGDLLIFGEKWKIKNPSQLTV